MFVYMCVNVALLYLVAGLQSQDPPSFQQLSLKAYLNSFAGKRELPRWQNLPVTTKLSLDHLQETKER